jgi:purine-nucleoside phosphorylase
LIPFPQQVLDAAAFIDAQLPCRPATAVITGTGLADAVGPLDGEYRLAYDAIPHYPVSTVESHTGRLIAGMLGDHPVAVLQGRVHLYEGYSAQTVSFSVRVMQTLGVRRLILVNAAGGMDPAFREGDLMVIRDHLNLTGVNPLVGPNHEAWGPRFPDMTAAYDRSLIQLGRRCADRLGIVLRAGVYAGLTGPSLETPAEIRWLKAIGADAVGFSTVMEAIAGVHGGMQVLGLSTITNINDPDRPFPASLPAIIAVASRTAPTLRRLLNTVIVQAGAGAPA